MINTINARDYFLRAMLAECFRHKAWVIEAFSFVENLDGKSKPYPYALTRGDGNSYTFQDPETGEAVHIEGTFREGPPFHFLDEIYLGVNDLPNVKKGVMTTYGNVLINMTCLVYAFGDKVEFQAGSLTPGGVEKIIEARLTDTPPAGTERSPDVLYVDEFKRFNEAMRHLEGFSQLCVPSASKKTMTVSPEVIKRRNELLKEYADRLEDPVIQAKIDRELVNMEREWMRGDPGERFYIKSKSYDIVRKRLHLMQGQENGFGKIGKVIKTSLSEGWDIDNLPDMANALRNGSYSRGFLTALGGVEAKGNYRIFQNTVVAEDDCKSKLGLRMTLDADIAKHFVSSSIIEKDGTVVELTEDNLKHYIDKPVVLRTVGYCRTAAPNVCAVCVGKKIAQTPNAISTYASDLGSLFVELMLKAMHGTALKTSTFDYRAMLR